MRRLLWTASILGSATAVADPDPPRPAVTRHGWQLELTGYIQVDAVVANEASSDQVSATGEPLNQKRVLIRRGRFRAEARKDTLSAAVEFDGNTNSGAIARLLGAQVGWRHKRKGDALPLVALTAGLFKSPFGVEVPASERDKAFLEPPAFARAIIPGNYDAGIMAAGAYAIGRWSIAVLNGAPAGDLQWKGKDPASNREFVGRIGVDVTGPRKLRVEAGVSALAGMGLHPGTPATKDQLKWVDTNLDGIVQITELQAVPAMAATPSRSFERRGLGADVQLHWCICRIGNGVAFAEIVRATNLDRGLVYADPISSARNFRELGFAVGAFQDLGDHAQVGVRYDRYDADRGVTAGVRPVFSTIGVMATGRWDDARLVVEYDHERNPLGRDAAGMPITLSANRVILRAQVGF